jgi:hypothetical protein
MVRCMGRFAELHRRAVKDGYIDVRDVESRYGLPHSIVYRHLRDIGCERLWPGLWVPSGQRLSHEVRCRAAVAYLGGDVLVTAQSALHALGVLRREPDKVELLLPSTRWIAPREGLCLHYTSGLSGIRTIRKDGVRLTATPRSLREYGRHATVAQLCTAMADAVRLRHCRLSDVGVELAGGARLPRQAAVRQAFGELSGELNHSGYERLGRRLLREAGEDVPSRPQPVVHRERNVAEIDIPFLDLAYGVEIDGPPHLLHEVAARDRERDRMLRRECGIEIDRYLWFELEEQPERFVREVTTRLRDLRTRRRS